MDYVIHNLSIWVESLSVCLSDHRHARDLVYAQSWDTDFAVLLDFSLSVNAAPHESPCDVSTILRREYIGYHKLFVSFQYLSSGTTQSD